ncbi:MAG: HAD family hydrolase, partial [Actinomycetota bacterium]
TGARGAARPWRPARGVLELGLGPRRGDRRGGPDRDHRRGGVVGLGWAGKPHPRIYEHTLARTSADPEQTLFVGDTWGPDVVGPQAFGMTPLYLLRVDHWPDPTAPDEPAAEALCATDLTAVLSLTDHG